MESKKKILVIENQEEEFKSIHEALKSTYDIIPTLDNYKTFIDNVRVWVNEQYEKRENYRATAFSSVAEVVKDVDLIIMDYVLGGSYNCLNGIDLADNLNKEKTNNEFPVLFLSKAEHNEEKRINAYDTYEKKYSKSKWVHKGYFGDEILNEDYINKHIVNEIKILLGEMKTNKKRFKIALSFPGEYREKIIEPIANILANKFSKNEILYDEFHEAEFARANLDIHLQKLYHDESELIVVCLCRQYNVKEWCGLEWRSIRDLLNRKQEDRIMFLRADNGDVDGIFGTIDGSIDVSKHTIEKVSELIIARYNLPKK